MIEQSLDLKRQIGDRAGIAWRLSVLGWYDIQNEEHEAATLKIRESLRIREDVGDRSRWAYTMSVLTFFDYISGNFSGALSKNEQALPVAREVSHHAMGDLLNLQTAIGIQTNQLAFARTRADEHLAYAIRSSRRYYQ